MKKSTILILIIVYLGSIFIVGVYGLRVRYGNETIYCDKITPTKIELSTGAVYEGEDIVADEKSEVPTYNITISSKNYVEGLKVLVYYNLNPADCTNKDVKIVIVSTSDDPPAKIVDGQIVFNRYAPAVTVKFYATDRGAGAAEMTINIRFGR